MTTASPPTTELMTAPPTTTASLSTTSSPTTEAVPNGKHINNTILHMHLFIDYNIPAVTFEITPSPLTVAVEQEVAIFYCQCLSCDYVNWRVNGTPPNKINSPNIYTRISGANSTLSIRTLPEYNGTRVQCTASLDGARKTTKPPVILLIQGMCTL